MMAFQNFTKTPAEPGVQSQSEKRKAIQRFQYAHPERKRIPAKAKPRGPFLIKDRFGNLKVVTPRKHGGERGYYKPGTCAQERECARRVRQMQRKEAKQ